MSLSKNYGIELSESMPRTTKIGLIASFLLLLTVNIVMLDLAVFSSRTFSKPTEMAAIAVRVTATPAPIRECSPTCEAAIEALNRRIDALPTMNTIVNDSPIVQTNNSGKEYNISLGSGTTKSNVWLDISGAEAVIDTANYPAIKSVTFEVFLNIPTANGTVYAKLFNVTDKHDVWFSNVSSEGPTLTKKEAVITLDSGAKTYRVMGLSTLKYDANIQNARIRIVTY